MDDERIEKEKERLKKLDCPAKDDRDHAPVGVLLSDEIKRYVKSFKMIDPFDECNNLKAAGYELTIGDEYVLGGVKKELRKDGVIRIPPFNVVVIMTAETINLPRFLIARWNLRVKWAYEGLLWVGAAQVDPGWVGHLFCPIYNLSDKVVEVRHGDPIALMDFVTTTPFTQESKPYKRPPKRVLLDEYNAVELKSGLTELAETKLRDFDDRIENAETEVEDRMGALQGRVDNFISITFAVVGLLFAAVTLFFGKPNSPNWWDPGVFWISALAIVVSMFAWVNSRSGVQWFRRPWQRMTFEFVIFVLICVAILSFSKRTQSNVGVLEQRVEDLQKQVSELNSAFKDKTPAAGPSKQH